MELAQFSIRIADYAPVKAALEAAAAVVEARGDAPWTLPEAIETLESALDALTAVNTDCEDDGN